MAKRKASSAPPPRKVSKASKPSGTGETSMVLIFFLVFSLLLNIGLGVATYFGFQHDDALKVANNDFKNTVARANDQKDWYRFQALLYRRDMGQLKAEDQADLAELRSKFDTNNLGKASKPKDFEEVSAFIKTVLDPNTKWNSAKKEPEASYETQVSDLKKQIETLIKENVTVKQTKDQAETKRKQAEDALKAEKDNSEKNLRDFQTAANKKLDGFFTTVEARNQAYEKLTNEMAAVRATDDAEKGKVEKQLQIAVAKIEGLKKEIDKKNQLIAKYEKDLGHDAPGELKTDWRIVSIDKNGGTAFINLGTSDKVVTGLTFRVHGIGEDGKPKPRDKATAEVLNVVNDHLSQVRVLYDYDESKEPLPQRHSPRRDPVLKGDVLYNPTWDPYQKKHVAIAGMIDLVGDGRDSLPELIRGLDRQNVVVDAYLDTKDFTIKGPGISVNTDLLIIGPTPRALMDARGADVELKTKLEEGVRTMRKQAEESGVKVRGLRQWLEEIGYKVPRGISDEPAYVNPPASPAKAGGDKVAPPPPVKPADVPPAKPADMPPK